jgi:hypothetical protein
LLCCREGGALLQAWETTLEVQLKNGSELFFRKQLAEYGSDDQRLYAATVNRVHRGGVHDDDHSLLVVLNAIKVMSSSRV